MGDVNNLFAFESLLTMPSNFLPLHLKHTFSSIIWIFTEGKGDGKKSRLPLKIFSTLIFSPFIICWVSLIPPIFLWIFWVAFQTSSTNTRNPVWLSSFRSRAPIKRSHYFCKCKLLSRSAHRIPNFMNPEFQFPQFKASQSCFFLFNITSNFGISECILISI